MPNVVAANIHPGLNKNWKSLMLTRSSTEKSAVKSQIKVKGHRPQNAGFKVHAQSDC
jgi:hypothetical protein